MSAPSGKQTTSSRPASTTRARTARSDVAVAIPPRNDRNVTKKSAHAGRGDDPSTSRRQLDEATSLPRLPPLPEPRLRLRCRQPPHRSSCARVRLASTARAAARAKNGNSKRAKYVCEQPKKHHRELTSRGSTLRPSPRFSSDVAPRPLTPLESGSSPSDAGMLEMSEVRVRISVEGIVDRFGSRTSTSVVFGGRASRHDGTLPVRRIARFEVVRVEHDHRVGARGSVASRSLKGEDAASCSVVDVVVVDERTVVSPRRSAGYARRIRASFAMCVNVSFVVSNPVFHRTSRLAGSLPPLKFCPVP